MKKNWLSPAKAIMLGSAFAGTLLLASCDKKDSAPVSTMYTISGSANGTQVVPAFNGTATGTITGTYDKQSNVLNYNVGWAGLTDTAGTVAFYSGASGVAGTPAQNLTVSAQGTTGNSTGTLTLTEEQELDLLGGNWYYSVGTLANVGGEIRGQIVATKQ
jgi:hypothetical protein